MLKRAEIETLVLESVSRLAEDFEIQALTSVTSTTKLYGAGGPRQHGAGQPDRRFRGGHRRKVWERHLARGRKSHEREAFALPLRRDTD